MWWDSEEESLEALDEDVAIVGELISSTERAILVRYNGTEAWLPKSLIETVMVDDKTIIVALPLWLEDEKFPEVEDNDDEIPL